MLVVRVRSALLVLIAVTLVVPLAACAPDRIAAASPAPRATPSAVAPLPSPTPTPTPSFDKTARSIDDPHSIWVVADKLRPLNPTNYVPPDLVQASVPHGFPPTLRKEAANAIVAMFAAAKAEGAGGMKVQSAYRSYATQVSVYNRFVRSVGKASADAQSARPGTSEHQTGLAADIGALPSKCLLAACFGQTPQGIWLAENGYRFGFLLRYPADKTAVTGYMYEPWHFRYIGVELATEMHDTGVSTLEEFFDLPPAPDYVG